MLLAHLVRSAAARTFCTAGSKSPMRMAMMAITTNNSTRVNARRMCGARGFMMAPWHRAGVIATLQRNRRPSIANKPIERNCRLQPSEAQPQAEISESSALVDYHRLRRNLLAEYFLKNEPVHALNRNKRLS